VVGTDWGDSPREDYCRNPPDSSDEPTNNNNNNDYYKRPHNQIIQQRDMN